MELILNLAWALAATLMVLLWLRCGLHAGSRRLQAVSLVVLLLVLFPVISVSDDLVSLQNPAEVDCCARRDHDVAAVISFVPPIVAAIVPISADQLPGVQRLSALGDEPALPFDRPALASVGNR